MSLSDSVQARYEALVKRLGLGNVHQPDIQHVIEVLLDRLEAVERDVSALKDKAHE